MHLISFSASPKQLSKLRNGHKVRIKKGTGFNLVVSPQNYHLVTRAFTKNKGVDVSLSPEEIQHNSDMTPEQHEDMAETVDDNLFQHLPFSEGGSIFKKAKKASKSKHGKDLRQSFKPVGREFLKAGQESAHQQIANAHMKSMENSSGNENYNTGVNLLANLAHEKVANVGKRPQTGGALFKALGSKKMKAVRRALKPAGRAFQNYAQDELHNQLGQMHMAGADYIPDNPNAQMGYNLMAQAGHDAIGYNRPPRYQQPMSRSYGYGLGAGLSGYEALKMQNLASADSNRKLAQYHNEAVHGQLTQPAIRKYWDGPFDPMSRGTGVMQMQGRGAILHSVGAPALQSQPFGANFHMQFFLPPEYRKFNDGTHVEGRGLYV
jgi:hypothetical protein